MDSLKPIDRNSLNVERSFVSEEDICALKTGTYAGEPGTEGIPTFLQKDFRNCKIGALINLRLERVAFVECDFRGVDLSGSEFIECRFRRCRLGGASFGNATFRDGYITECDLKAQNGASKTDFTSASLVRMTIYRSYFEDVIICGARLGITTAQGSTFGGCRLEEAISIDSGMFAGADLDGCDLRDSCLAGCGFQESFGLAAEQFGGASLKNAELPTEIAKFEPLEIARESSKRAGKVFLFMLALCLYGLVTFYATTDAQLITNAPSLQLPTIGTVFTTRDLFLWLPILIAGVYVWFHLYLYDMWLRFSRLPAVFPDGVPLDRKAYPWPLNSLVRKYFPMLNAQGEDTLGTVSRILAISLAWWAVPVTFLLSLLRYIRLNEFGFTFGTIMTLIVTSSIGAVLTYQFAIRELSHDRFRKSKRHWIFAALLIAAAAICSFAANSAKISVFNVNLVDADLSSRYSVGPRTRLQNLDLRGAQARGASFRESHLENVDLSGADLREADFYNTTIRNVNMCGARLAGAYFDCSNGTVIENLDLSCTDLRDLKSWYLSSHQTDQVHMQSAIPPHSSMTDAQVDSVLSQCKCEN